MRKTPAMVPILLLCACPTAAEPPPTEAVARSPTQAVAPSTVTRDADVPTELVHLRDRLLQTGEVDALRDVPRFRALCDAQGYPLVGNLVRKSGMYQPSAFCSHVREHKA